MRDNILFIDESGDHSLNNINADFPIFALLGLMIDKNSYKSVCEEINNFKLKYFKTINVILHSREIRKCEGVFSVLFDLKIKEEFYKDLNAIISNANFTLVSSTILKQKHVEQYGKLADDPYEIALTFVLERVLYELDARKVENKLDIIIESRGSNEDQTLAKRYNELLYKGSGVVTTSRFVSRYNQELLFKRKAQNDIGLQLADLCAYPIARHVLYPEEPYPSFEVIKSKIRNNKGKVEGFGIKIFP